MSGTGRAGLVSIIIPVLNRADLLVETLRSVLAQDYPHLECLVMDDASDEDIAGGIQSAGLNDPRVRVVRQTVRSGANPARNRGFELSEGEFVLFFDADDLMAPTKLSLQVAALEADTSLDGVLGQAAMMRERPFDTEYVWNTLTPDNYLLRFLLHDVAFHTSAPLWRRTFLHRAPSWRDCLKAHQDFEFHITALACRPKLAKAESALAHYRLPSGSSTSNMRAAKHVAEFTSVIHHLESCLKGRLELDEWTALLRLHAKSCRLQAFVGPWAKSAQSARALARITDLGAARLGVLWCGLVVAFLLGLGVRALAGLLRYRLQGTPERWTSPVRCVFVRSGLESAPRRWWLNHSLAPDVQS